MYTEVDLAAAVDAGVLSAESAAALRAFVAQVRPTPAMDEENFRLVTGFNDIFVVIACALLLLSVAWIGSALTPWAGATAAAALAWGLAEYFVRRRHMALPAIVLLLAFVGALFAAGLLAAKPLGTGMFVAGAALAALGAWLHWRRCVPITIAAGTGAVVGALIAGVLAAAPGASDWINGLSLAAGVIVFALAMRWDMADPRRETRLSDVAFWLHLLAAPLLVRPIFALLGVTQDHGTLVQSLLVVVIYVLLAVVSLAIDRRALMVSALVYVLYTFSALLNQFGVVNLNFAFAACVIGSGLVLLSAFWHRTRVHVLRALPAALTARLPPVR